ncbi:hypothetical protein JCM13304A_08190 [Desulfothermus okinawensis JCM 13304]
MEILDLLEKKIDHLLGKLRELEEENKQLKEELIREKGIREQVSKKIDNLLQKMEDIDIT